MDRLVQDFEDLSDDGLFGDASDFSPVSGALAIAEPEAFTAFNTEAVPDVSEQITSNRNGGRCHALGSNEKDRHADTGFKRDCFGYSKNVFILSKKPSPLGSMDMPLSLAYSIKSSFCRAVSLVGI